MLNRHNLGIAELAEQSRFTLNGIQITRGVDSMKELPQLEPPKAKVSRLAVTQALEYLAQLLDEQPQLIFQGGLAESTAVQDRVLEILNDCPEVA